MQILYSLATSHVQVVPCSIFYTRFSSACITMTYRTVKVGSISAKIEKVYNEEIS